MAELVTQMNSVVADKTNLESRVSVLLRVLQMRDEQIEQLRSGQKVGHVALFASNIMSAEPLAGQAPQSRHP